MDNHRPFHLKNVHSHYNVVCFDENYIYEDDDDDDIPSEASVMSSNVGDRSDDDTLNSEDEEESLGDEEEEDFNDFAVSNIILQYEMVLHSISSFVVPIGIRRSPQTSR